MQKDGAVAKQLLQNLTTQAGIKETASGENEKAVCGGADASAKSY